MNKVPLSEIADITPGFAFKSSQFGPTGHKVVKIKDITPPFVETANSDCVVMDAEESQKLKKFRISRGDFVVAMTGATIGKVGIYVDEGVAYINQRVAKIDAKGDNNKSFIYYCLCSERFIKFIFSNLDSSSAQGNISADGIGRYTVSDVAFSTQRKIASILSALDDKIELNRKINAELEQMARTLYDYWFVQFDFPDANGKPYKSFDGQMVYNEQLKREIPKGWETLKLQDALEFEKGTEPGTDAYSEIQNNEYDLPFYRVGDIDGQTGTYIDSSKTKTKTVKPTDVIVTFDGSVGKMGLGLDGAISGGLRHIYDKAGKISDAGIYAIFSDEYITKTIERYATGSVILHASSSIPYLVIPYDEKVFAEFQKIIEPMFAKIIANRQQSQKLAELRDWLLPMLMNGQVRVD